MEFSVTFETEDTTPRIEECGIVGVMLIRKAAGYNIPLELIHPNVYKFHYAKFYLSKEYAIKTGKFKKLNSLTVKITTEQLNFFSDYCPNFYLLILGNKGAALEYLADRDKMLKWWEDNNFSLDLRKVVTFNL
jgi:hypothetical protein